MTHRTRRQVGIRDALTFLRTAVKRDSDAIERLVHLRVYCGPKLMQEDGAVVFRNGEFSELALFGPLELLNSVFGKQAGCIEPVFDRRGRLRDFAIVRPCHEVHHIPECADARKRGLTETPCPYIARDCGQAEEGA